MAEKAVFTMKLDAQLRADFMAAAAAADRPASQVVRELMRDFVKQQREARACDAFLQDKVAAARASLHADGGVPNDEVEALFAQRRAEAALRA
ncbi:MAG: antitoxin of toxin-antitoxin stability system [Elsteraceae bacterium]